MLEPVQKYWKIYGGWNALANSPYLFFAALFSLICYPLWLRRDTGPWADFSISIMPSLMGFSVAAMAVLLAFSQPNSLKAITEGGREDSYFVQTVANLFHFLLAQVIALMIAIFAKAHSFPLVSFIGMTALIYAVFVAISAAGQLLNTALIINKATSLSEGAFDQGSATHRDAQSDSQSSPDTEKQERP